MQFQNKNAFTLVELIVGITILSILGTIAFVSFNGYTQNARDTVRKNDAGNIEEVLQLYYIKNRKFPTPSESFDVVYSGYPLWSQGVFGQQTQAQIGKIFGDLADPKYGNQYSYSVTQSQNEYQLGVVYERTEIGSDDWRFTHNLIPQTFADQNPIVNLDPNAFGGLQAWYDGRDADNDGIPDYEDTSIGNVGIVSDVVADDFTPFYFDRVIWLDAQDIRGNGIPYSDGADVTTWRNKTGAGFDGFVPQTGNGNGLTISSAPDYTSTGFNGNPGVYFNGTNDRLSVDRGAQPNGSSFSLAYTFKINDAGGNSAENAGTNHATIISVGPSGGGAYHTTNGGWQLSRDARKNNFIFRINGNILESNKTYFNGTNCLDDSGISSCGTSGNSAEVAFGNWSEVNDDDIHTVFLTYEGNILTGYLDGTKRFEAIMDSDTVPFGEYFRFYGNRAGNEYLEGHLGEVFIANEKISLQDIEKIEGYFAHRWDWIDELPVGHPYKTNPPQMDPASQMDYTRFSGLGYIPDSFDAAGFYGSSPSLLNTKTVRYPGSMPDINISETNKLHIWRGPMKVDTTGDYTFSLSAKDYGFIHINGNTIVDAGGTTTGTQSGVINLTADTLYDFELIYGVDQNELPTLSDAWNVSPGYYNFNIGGESFRTYVDSDGWVLVASGRGATDRGRYDLTTNLTLQSDSILRTYVTNTFTDMSEIRINESGNPGFDVRSSHSEVISRFLDYDTLGYDATSNSHNWTGSGSEHMTIGSSCNGGSTGLHKKIYHACNNGDGMHWLMENNREEIDYNAGDVDLNLWVRADQVESDVFGNLEYRVDGPGVIGYRKYDAFGWDDRSTHGNNLEQLIPERQPSYNVSAQSFIFEEDDYFDFTSQPYGVTDDIEMFVVWEVEDDAIDRDLDGYIFENTLNNSGSIQFGAQGMRAGNQDLESTTVVGKQTQLSSYKVTRTGSGNLSYYLGGQNYDLRSANLSNFDLPFVLGGKEVGFNGNVKEILIYNSLLANSEREQIEGYLSHKWSIAHKLPGVHPYYEALDSEDQSYVELLGNYNGIFVHSELGDSHIVVASPSITSSLGSTSTTVDITTLIGENRLVFSGHNNVPASYSTGVESSEKLVTQNGFFFDVGESKIFDGSKFELANYKGISDIDTKVRSIYGNSRNYKHITNYLESNNTDYVKDILRDVIGINPITPYYCKDILEKSIGSNIGYLANISGSSGEQISGGVETLIDNETSIDEDYTYKTNPGETTELSLEWNDVYEISLVQIFNSFGDISQNLWLSSLKFYDENDLEIYEHILGDTLGLGVIEISVPEAVSNQGIKRIVLTPVTDYDEIALREIAVFAGGRPASGIYKVDADGVGGIGSYNVYCDMATEGGGWTKVGENYIDKGNFQGGVHSTRFSGYLTSGNKNNVSENNVLNISTPSVISDGNVLRHSGDANSYYELYFDNLPDVEFSSELRLGAWVRGSTSSVINYELEYEGRSPILVHENFPVGNPSNWRYETLRIPLTDTVESFTWKIGQGIDASSTPLDITGLSLELYYK